MQRKLVKKSAYNAGKTATDKELVFQHMSNHYRRILNAKKAVDTSPPYCYKLKRPNTSTSKGNRSDRRNLSPAFTDRSLSTNSYKGSCWGTDSYLGSSRYHAGCIPECPPAVPTKYTLFDMDLINRITFDTKNAPAAYCDEGWMEIKAKQNEKRYRAQVDAKQNKNSVSTANTKRRLPSSRGVNENKQRRKFSIQGKFPSTTKPVKYTPSNSNFHPKILKTEAVSKLRSLRVYYPPRRKQRAEPKSQPNLQLTCSSRTSNCKCANICICDPGEDFKKTSGNPKESQTSSRDSAYNGGVSSLPESRSPTPDQKRKKDFRGDEGCYCEEKEISSFKIDKDSKTKKESEGFISSGVESTRETARPSSAAFQLKREPEKSFSKMKEDALYVKFIQDITVEVLGKCLYTNKALKKVMKRHVLENLQKLDKDRMLREVDILRIQLGIPEDKTLFDLSVDVVESSTDILTPPYPEISDSEFVMPKLPASYSESAGTIKTKEKEVNEATKKIKTTKTKKMTISCDDIPKSVSKVVEQNKMLLASGSDEDVVSVVQLTKSLKEKRRASLPTSGILAPSRGNSADESDQSSEGGRRPKMRTSKQESMKTRRCTSEMCSSSSSSEVEELKKYAEHDDSQDSKENDGGEKKESFFSNVEGSSKTGKVESGNVRKKGRSVSFWNNKDHAISESIEIKQTKTLATFKKS